MAGQFVFVGLLGNECLPLEGELVDDAREREHQRLPKQSGLGAEVPEQQVFGDACAFGDLARCGAAIVLAGEQLTGGVEQQPARLAAGAAGGLSGRLRRAPACGRSSLRHGGLLLEPRSRLTTLTIVGLDPALLIVSTITDRMDWRKGPDVGQLIMLGTLFGLIVLIFGLVLYFDPEARGGARKESDQ